MNGINTLISLVICCCLSFSQVVYASCPKPVQLIEKDEKANCSGFLFSDEAEKRAAKARDDAKFYELLVPTLEERINKGIEREKILEQRLDLYIKQSEVLANDRAKSERRKFWERIGLFALGALAMYGAVELAENR